MQKILVVYMQYIKSDRNTINEHLYAFDRYAKAEVWHYNAAGSVPVGLTEIDFDLIVFHYTFLGGRWGGSELFRRLMRRVRSLASMPAKKIAFPQDEYVHSEVLCEFFRDFGIDAVFTCFDEIDRKKAYPDEKVGETKFFKTFTGYVDNQASKIIPSMWKPHSEREFDVGYRARKVPFWLGHHGTLKWRLTEEFTRASGGHGLSLNVSNDSKDVFFGRDWYKFLANCRVVLGCEGGATLHDPEGKIRAAVEDFSRYNPSADFATVERACFPGLDNGLQLTTLSPRHFEAAMTKTCQALVEGRYEGLLKPDVHYIPIQRDFSNLETVVKKIQDREYCEAMAERTYVEIAASGHFTYESFVGNTLSALELGVSPKAVKRTSCEAIVRLQLKINDFFWIPLVRTGYGFKSLTFRIMVLLRLAEPYRSLRKRLSAS